jgi:hypothetical protein
LKASWLLTLNDVPEVREVFTGCKLLPVARPRGISGTAAEAYRELIIRSPGAPELVAAELF